MRPPIVGAFPVIAGALVQRAKGNDPVAPDPTPSHAADTLSMMLGRKPTRARSRRSTPISSRCAITA
jgi:citrate synthase